MYDYKNSHYTVDGAWRSLFGLSISDLSDDQLNKLTFGKLIEFIGVDDRVNTIVMDKLLNSRIDDISDICSVPVDDIANCDVLKDMYNKFISHRRDDIDLFLNSADRYVSQSSLERYVKFKLLDDKNKYEETVRLVNKKPSVMSTGDIDYGALYNRNPDIALKIIRELFSNRSSHAIRHVLDTMDHKMVHNDLPEISKIFVDYMLLESSSNYNVPLIISGLTKDVLINTLPEIEKNTPQKFSYVLGNEHLPKNYIIKALRIIAKRTYSPSISVKINKDVLEELPPVCRLDALESIFYNLPYHAKLPFDRDVTEDVMKNILFPSSIRYTKRVSNVMQKFINHRQREELTNERI